MSFKVKTISVFENQAKRLIKKYPSLKKEIKTLVSEIKKEPTLGTPIGFDCYKTRLAIASKSKGKSGGARVITHLIYKEDTVYLLTIYHWCCVINRTNSIDYKYCFFVRSLKSL